MLPVEGIGKELGKGLCVSDSLPAIWQRLRGRCMRVWYDRLWLIALYRSCCRGDPSSSLPVRLSGSTAKCSGERSRPGRSGHVWSVVLSTRKEKSVARHLESDQKVSKK